MYACCGVGAIEEELESPLVVLVVDDELPQGFDAMEDPALLQSTPEPFEAVYDGVVVGGIIPFMLMAGLDCCCGWAYKGLPMPGLLALSAGNEELRLLSVLSGVSVRVCAFGAARLVLGGGDIGGLDHENVAAGDALFDLMGLRGRDGRTVDADADELAFDQELPPSISVPPEDP